MFHDVVVVFDQSFSKRYIFDTSTTSAVINVDESTGEDENSHGRNEEIQNHIQ